MTKQTAEKMEKIWKGIQQENDPFDRLKQKLEEDEITLKDTSSKPKEDQSNLVLFLTFNNFQTLFPNHSLCLSKFPKPRLENKWKIVYNSKEKQKKCQNGTSLRKSKKGRKINVKCQQRNRKIWKKSPI